jgi:PAS domain S-box-containing protein
MTLPILLLSILAGGMGAVAAVMALLWRERRMRAGRSVAGEPVTITPQMRELADHAFDAMFLKDDQGRYVMFNTAAAKHLNVDAAAVLGKTDASLFPDMLPAIRQRDQDVQQASQPQTFEETLDTPHGPRTFLTTKGQWKDEQGRRGVFGVARDITQMAEAREHLRRSEQRFRLAAAGGDVWDWDLEKGTSGFETSFWRRLGYVEPVNEQAFDFFSAVMHPQDRQRWQVQLREHLTQRKPYALEFRAHHRDGHWVWFRTRGQAIWSSQGRATYMAGTTYDVTAEREAEQEVVRARSELRELTQRLMDQERKSTAQIAHALHDQLGQILGGTRLHLDMALNHKHELSHVARQRMDRVSSLVDYAIEEVRRVLVALRPPLLEEQGLYAALDNEIRCDNPFSLGVKATLVADAAAQTSRWPAAVEHAVFMVAREALANALKHANASSIELSLDGDGQRLALAVADNGVGIAQAVARGRPGHLGMVGMRERAAAIGADFSVQAASQGGTRVQLTWTQDTHG